MVDGGIAHQTWRCLQNLDEVLKATQRSTRDLVHVGVYIRDLDVERSRRVDQVFQRWSVEHPILCARSVLGVTYLPLEASVCIDAVCTTMQDVFTPPGFSTAPSSDPQPAPPAPAPASAPRSAPPASAPPEQAARPPHPFQV